MPGFSRGASRASRARTDGVDVHVVIVDNGSVKASALEYLEELKTRPDVTVIRIDDGFDYSALCNAGSRDPDQMRTTSS